MTSPPQQPQPPPPPARLLALDPGERRIGVAISDELGLYAHPRPAIILRGALPLGQLSRLVAEERVTEVVVGKPLSLAGGETRQTAVAHEFATRLRSVVSVPVIEWDERLSSVEAARTVRGAARRSSGELDSAAAAVVLQSVLDARRGGIPR
jgi:putative pre-16S rRNA nuclease